MAKGNDRDRDSRRRGPKDAPRKGAKKKVCVFCSEHIDWVDYKDVNLLRRFMSDRGKIRSRRVSGNCAQHQREVAVAIKTARELALLPYTQRTVTERAGGRGGGRGGPRDRTPDRPAEVEEDELAELAEGVLPADDAEDLGATGPADMASVAADDGGEEG